MLGSFLFSGDDIFKKVEVLSPGERSRVALAKISLTGANTLLLDEPTNHLDPMTQLIISDTFKNYEGTMLVVCHPHKTGCSSHTICPDTYPWTFMSVFLGKHGSSHKCRSRMSGWKRMFV